jgi:ABC-type multidrug transport system ATPase subunit
MESPDADTTTLPKSFTTKLQMHESIRLDWKDINYNMMVKNPKSTPINTIYDDKQILRSQSGFARSGEMLAIMGPTGCGKTSLLNILAARAPLGSKKFAKLSGEVYVNGRSRKDETFRSLSAYVLQDDKLYPHLTVFETLLVAAHFYLPNSFTLAEKEELVESVIGELGLRKARNTIIGDEKVRGVSGGERRRANIAVQLITNPSVLFLDEPTSGLDAFQAQSVMEAMKSMSDNNRLVISVIHQPRSSIYNMFDRLLLLSEGRVMYFGNADAAVDYFNAVGYLCPDNFSPSDYYLDVLSPDNRTPELDLAAKERIDQLDLHWRTTSKIESNKNEVIPSEGDVPPASGQGGRVFENLKILCWRSFVEQCRDLSTLKLKFFISIFFGLLIGGIYSGTRLNQHGIQNRTGLLFLIVINQVRTLLNKC